MFVLSLRLFNNTNTNINNNAKRTQTRKYRKLYYIYIMHTCVGIVYLKLEYNSKVADGVYNKNAYTYYIIQI